MTEKTRPYVFGVVMPCRNQVFYTALCVEAFLRHRPEDQKTILVMVDNGSTDGTPAYLDGLKALCESRGVDFALITNPDNAGWSKAINQGFALIRDAGGADYYVQLNNDTIPAAGFLEGMASTYSRAPEALADPWMKKVGAVGPVSNNVAGVQKLQGFQPEFREADQAAADCRMMNVGNFAESHFLSGFCIMFSAECYDALRDGDNFLDPVFWTGFDDNDICLRSQLAGFRNIICPEVFLFHFGHVSLDKEAPQVMRGMKYQREFGDKWAAIKRRHNRLIAMIRTKNGATNSRLADVLDHTATFADGIVVLSDGSDDGATEALCVNHPAVVMFRHYAGREFDERRDRNELIEMAREVGADWIIAVDDDEIFEMTRTQAVRLMTLREPHALAVCFKWYTFWDDREELYRDDGIFGTMTGFRMARLLPNSGIFKGNKMGLHCGNIPSYPAGNCVISSIRVRHYGYCNEKKREQKFDFYSKMDRDLKPELVGSSSYHHVKEQDVVLRRWASEDGISLNVITKNEAGRLDAFLAFFEPFVSEIVLVDTGSTDGTKAIAAKYTDKIFDFPMDESNFDLSAPRNLAIKNSTMPWVLVMDCDEKIDQSVFWKLRRMMNDTETSAYLFTFANHLPSANGVAHSESIRMFRNIPGAKFSRPVHETMEESFKRIPGARIRAAGDFVVDHYGFLTDPDKMQEKIDLYLRVTKKYHNQNPADPQPEYNIAMHYWNLGELDECERYLKKSATRAERGFKHFYNPFLQLAVLYQTRAKEMLKRVDEMIGVEGHPMKNMAQRNIHVLGQITPEPAVLGRDGLEMKRAREIADAIRRKG